MRGNHRLEMKKLFLIGIAALSVLSASAAHAREWQGNMLKPIGKLPPYPPVVCVAPNWTPEPCESRQPSPKQAGTAHADDLGDILKPLWDFFKWTETNWLGTILVDYRPWDGAWPTAHAGDVEPEVGGMLPVPSESQLRAIDKWQDPMVVRGTRYTERPYPWITEGLRINPGNWDRMIRETPPPSTIEDRRETPGIADGVYYNSLSRGQFQKGWYVCVHNSCTGPFRTEEEATASVTD
jgi:hypothetical protein